MCEFNTESSEFDTLLHLHALHTRLEESGLSLDNSLVTDNCLSVYCVQ